MKQYYDHYLKTTLYLIHYFIIVNLLHESFYMSYSNEANLSRLFDTHSNKFHLFANLEMHFILVLMT